MEIEEYLAIPYILRMESTHDRDGKPVCRAEYPELPDCVVEGHSALDALDRLEAAKTQLIRELMERGERVPSPRPPLPELLPPHLRLRYSPRSFTVVGG